MMISVIIMDHIKTKESRSKKARGKVVKRKRQAILAAFSRASVRLASRGLRLASLRR